MGWKLMMREINLGVEENMISNEYAVKLCLEHKVKRGNKMVKKELIVALRGEIYFVKFIINLEEDDVEPGVILERTFLRMTKAIIDFGDGTVTIYPDIDPFLEYIEEEEKSLDDWDHLLDFNLDDVPLLGEEELPPFVCKMGKSNRNKKRAMENLNFFYQDMGTSSSVVGHLTQEEAKKEALAIRISRKFALLKEKDKVELDGKIMKEEEEVVQKIKGKALKEKDDPGAFIFPIRLEGLTMGTHDYEAGSSISKRSRQHETVKSEPIYAEFCHEFYSTYEFDEVYANDELQTKKIIKFRLDMGFNVYFEGGLRSDEHFNAQEYWLSISREENLGLSRSHTSTIRSPILRVIHKMITYGLYQRTTGYDKVQKNDLWLLIMFDARHQNGNLDTTTLRDLIDSEGKLIPEDPQLG
ncbi:hypothetical protein Tco_0894946 [Tanacetum coccineum]|uniref:Uncharacterized protein n=1 Tax=Tanacetum coccineum TaxID=301880 RepID=A0ABQ5CEF0_9ASTR